jgi:hypothetical protein
MTGVSDSQKITFRSEVLTWLLNKRNANSSSFMGECNTVPCRKKTRYNTMCKTGSESHYILSFDALSDSRYRLDTREKSLKSPLGIRLDGPQKKNLFFARIERQSFSRYSG